MNPAILNLIAFAVLVIGGWLLVKALSTKNIMLSRVKKQKTITEDILKQLFHVQQSKRTATINSLSGALKIRRSKILPMIVQMTQAGLVETINDTIRLTEEGSSYGLKIIRTHRLWEKYLAEKTGHQAADWHYLAEKMEHQLTENETTALSNSLGNPLFDPHGDPIPTKEGDIAPVEWIPLPTYPVNTPGKIAHIEDEPGVVYQQILAKRILVGSHVKIMESGKNEIIISSEGQNHSFSPIVAANISIIPLNSDEVYEESAERLSSLKKNQEAEVIGISKECRGANRRRLLDLGILQGTKIQVDMESPLKDPIAYRVRNTSIALRNSLADLILIKKT